MDAHRRGRRLDDADLLMRLGRVDEARAELERAARLTRNARERDIVTARSEGIR